MASAQEYIDYINKMRQLRADRDAGLMTTKDAVGAAPARPKPEQTSGTMKQWGENIIDSFKGGISSVVPDVVSNLWDSTRAVGRGIVATPGVLWKGTKYFDPKPKTPEDAMRERLQTYKSPYQQNKTATITTGSTPSKTVNTPGASSDIMGPPDMTVSSGQVPKRFVLGSGPTNTIYGGALVRKPSVDKYGLNNNFTNSVYTPEQIRAIGDSPGSLFAPQSPARPIFGNTTSAAEIAKAAAEYKAFMEGSLKRYNEFLARTGYKSGPQGMTRRERQAQLDRDAALAQQTAWREMAAAENDKNRQAELLGRQIIADAQVAAAKEGKPDAKSQDAALLKEYVAAWSLATEAEKPALMAKIMEIGGGGAQAEKPVARDKAGKEVFMRNGKYVYADGTEYKAARP